MTPFFSENAPVFVVDPAVLSMPRTESYSVTQYSSPIVAEIVPVPPVTEFPSVVLDGVIPIGQKVMPVTEFSSSLRFATPVAR